MKSVAMTAAIFAATMTLAGRATTAAAQSESYEPITQAGIEVTAGAGVQDFTYARMRDATALGGLWDLRAIVGSRSMLAFEGAYTGSAQTIDSILGPSASATLVGTTVSGAVRANILPRSMVTPFAFAGVGWQRYDITGSTFTTSDNGINNKDNLLAIPFGAGLSMHARSFTADARFTYNVLTNEDMVIAASRTNPNGAPADMDNWGASARVGYEF